TFLTFAVAAPTYVPTGNQLFNVSIQQPIYQTTRGSATLSFGSMKTGVAFQIDETPVPIFYSKAKVIVVTFNGVPAVMYELGNTGKGQLVALTWSIGRRFFDITSNLGKSGLAENTLV